MLLQLILAGIATLILAELSYRLVERPALNLKRRFAPEKASVAASPTARAPMQRESLLRKLRRRSLLSETPDVA
jgi:peptidoglycan/LPS O-acetylase OafA/YrhL